MSIRIFGSAVPVFYIFCFVQHLSWDYCAQRALAIVAIVFPSSSPFPPAAPSAWRFSSVILGSDFLSVVLDAVVLSVGKRREKKTKTKTELKKNEITFPSTRKVFRQPARELQQQ